MSAVSPDAVTRYLERRGITPAMSAWKYFDGRFNRSRERAMVWLRSGEVAGFIGLIPFRMQTPGGVQDTAWTCDWSVDAPERNPGMGIILLRSAIAASTFTMSIGGNEVTRSLMPRLAAQTIEQAGRVYIRPLRLDYVLEKVDRRVRRRLRGAPALAGTLLGRIRWPRPLRRPSGAVTIAPGISRQLEPLMVVQSDGTPRPLYDFEYVDWQCGRCPCIDSWTCLAPGPGDARAAAVLFRTHHRPADWRLVGCFGSSAIDQMSDVVASAAQFALQRSAASLSMLVSGHDTAAAAVLRAHGFALERGGHPLYVSTSKPGSVEPFPEVRGLSYIDADLAYTI